MTVSSSPSRLQSAGRPSTVIDRTVSPSKSRLKLDRFCVARAEMVAVPVEHVGARIVGDLQHVVLDVVAAVAVQREVRIADSRGAGRELRLTLRLGLRRTGCEDQRGGSGQDKRSSCGVADRGTSLHAGWVSASSPPPLLRLVLPSLARFGRLANRAVPRSTDGPRVTSLQWGPSTCTQKRFNLARHRSEKRPSPGKR